MNSSRTEIYIKKNRGRRGGAGVGYVFASTTIKTRITEVAEQ